MSDDRLRREHRRLRAALRVLLDAYNYEGTDSHERLNEAADHAADVLKAIPHRRPRKDKPR